jgi:hypothetical protein
MATNQIFQEIINRNILKKKPVTKKIKLTRKEKDDIYRSMGLIKVRGAVSGKIYWE